MVKIVAGVVERGPGMAIPGGGAGDDDDDASPIEEVRMTVPATDDPTLPVWTFRMWTLGLLSFGLMSFFNQFFSYRTEPIIVTQITVQVASLPLGHLLARVLPVRKFRLPALLGGGEFSLNPGPFNMKEHVLISIFANAGCAFGNGSAYAVMIVDIIRAFYRRSISFFAAWLLITTTQVLGYGWAGLMRRYVVEQAHMWWPGTLVQVSLFRALHEKEDNDQPAAEGGGRTSRSKFFLVALAGSFLWYAVPGYLAPTLTSVSWVCWIFSKSVTAQQLGSGMRDLGLGAFTLDWTAPAGVAVLRHRQLVFMYVVVPAAYWGLDLYNARRFPIFSSHLFAFNGEGYDINAIVNDRFEIDMDAYQRQGRINMITFFALSYGLSFAAIAATITHVALFHGKEIYRRFRASRKEDDKPDVHTRLMRKYDDAPGWWFHSLLALSAAVSLVLCTVLKKEVQLPWWGLLFACAMAFVFTLPISIITATTNQTPGLNVLSEYVIGLILPGKPIANVCFKVFGYMSMSQAVSFLAEFKLGHYMKIPPKSMFLVQLVGTVVAGTVNLGVAYWLLGSVPNIYQDALLPADSPWTCPSDRVFFDASVIWGLVGPRRIFGPLGNYGALNWFFLAGAAGPAVVYALHRAFPARRWIRMINLPVLIGATASMPPATAVNYNSWLLIGVAFNFFVFRYRKRWWERYNYILSAVLDAGVAFMGVLLYFAMSMENRNVSWWGTAGEHCPLASCPTAREVDLGPDSVCPVVL
ncbi:oligopeptide transporter 4-like [Panicum miliaceum]|uniref:Oligopeptide transporter 4-like n=1 Tax=Panicum miliaceum TaxID=4540 RepID=A0A3L6SHG6_PANMI|nr:oligopeptide transporter 4-like [Panicum miliaceum]